MAMNRNSFLRRSLQSYLQWIYEVSRDARLHYLEQQIDVDSTAHLLDCGCREGEGSLVIAAQAGTRHISGIDYTFSVLKQAHLHGIIAICADLNVPIPLKSGTYDVIYASNLIEHLVDPALFIAEAYRMLRPGGYLVVDTPNLASWHNIFALLIGRQPFSGPNLTNMEDAEVAIVRELHRTDHGLPEEGPSLEHGEQELTRHIVVVAYHSLLDLLRTKGFHILSARGFGYYPLPPLLARLFERIDPAHAHHTCVKAVRPAAKS
jgi:SAM-dependent methyltransferase